MPGRRSAGLLVYPRRPDACEVFLIHPGGPFWQAKDSGVWSIPKGELSGDESSLDAARREFAEETGFEITGDFRLLAPIKQRGVHDRVAAALGPGAEFPEVDRAAWFTIDDARGRITARQRGFLDQLCQLLNRASDGPTHR